MWLEQKKWTLISSYNHLKIIKKILAPMKLSCYLKVIVAMIMNKNDIIRMILL